MQRILDLVTVHILECPLPISRADALGEVSLDTMQNDALQGRQVQHGEFGLRALPSAFYRVEEMVLGRIE